MCDMYDMFVFKSILSIAASQTIDKTIIKCNLLTYLLQLKFGQQKFGICMKIIKDNRLIAYCILIILYIFILSTYLTYLINSNLNS